MDVQEIMKYVLETPENTNPAILKGMLEELKGADEEDEGGGGGSDLKIFNVTVQGHKNGTGNEFPVLESSTFIVYYPDPERPEIYETQSLQITSEPQTFSLVTARDSIQASLNASGGVIDSVETTGNVTYLQEYLSVSITGDCTIDITFTTGG